MAAADVQKRIDELTQKLNENKITVEQFNKQYEKLRKELDKELKIYLETRVREPEKTSEQSIAELADAFRRAGATGYVQEQAEKIKKEIQESGEDIGEQNLEDFALRRATQRYKRQILPKLAASTEYQKLIEPSKFVSTIVDPKKGLVFDPKTGDVRKAGDVELGIQALKPQVVYSAAELEPVGKGAEAKLLRQQTERLRKQPMGFAAGMSPEEAKTFSKGLIEQEKRAKKLQEEFERDPKYRVVEEAGYVVESPLAYSFGMLNTGSAAMAPLVKGIQDLITPGAKTRPERYKKTEREGLLGQFLTNVATRQGMFDQFQAQLLPPEMEVDGVTALFLQEGSPLTMALGIATEFTAGITPVGTVADIAKVAKTAGKFVTPSLMKYAQQVEIDTALRAADAKKSVKEIKKELKAEGKNVTPVTLRGRAAETIGDVYAAERVLQDVVENPRITVGQVKQMTKNSPTVEAVTAGLDDAVSITQAQDKIRELSKSLRQKTIRGKKEIPTLRRAYDVGEDVRLLIREGKKPRFDADLVRRNVRGAAVRIDPSATPVADLIKESYTRPLTDTQLDELANGLKDIKADRFTKPEETIYEATRSAVAEVLRDNFLKNIPDDMIAVGRSVVVPAKKITKRAFRKNPELDEYLKRRKEYIEHTSTTTPLRGREYRLTEDAQRNIRALFEAQDSVVPFKIDEALNASEFSILQNKIAEDLAIELLDGIRLQQGSLTAEFARLKGAERATLISPVTGKRGSFIISAKGLANSLRIISPRRFAFLDKFFPKMQMPPTMARFTREMTEQANRAFRQVEDRLKKIGGKDEVAREQLLADEIERSMQQGIQVKMNRMEQQAPRAQEGIADVTPEIQQRFLKDEYAQIKKTRALLDERLSKIQRLRQQAQQKYDQAIENLRQREIADPSAQFEIDSLYQKFSRQLDSYLDKLEIRERNLRQSQIKREEKIKEVRQKKQETLATRQKKKGFIERYGREAVDSSLETLGIKTYDDLLANLDDLQNNMGGYIEAVYRADQWRTLINKFFTNPDKKFAKNSAPPSYYIDQLKRGNDFDKTFLVSSDASLLDAANIMRVTPENFKIVIERIRESAPELKKYGLSTNPLLKNREDYFLPILEVMVDIQRTENMQSAVQRFIVEDPDLLVRVGQTYNSTAGLDAINSMASALETTITNTLKAATQRGLLKDVEVQLLIEQCKETLFSAAMNDIWKATGRDSQIKFLQMYFTDSIQQQRLINGMSDSLINMYNDKVLKSTTFDRIRSKSETILGNLVKKLERAEAITDETRPIVERFIEQVPQVIAQMEEKYLLNLVGKDSFTPGLFGDQVNELYSYMSRYGISEEVTINSLKRLQPTLEYIGSSNLALIHGGDISGVFDNINSLFKNPTFEDRLKRLAMFGAPANQYAAGKIVQSALSLAAAASKMSISNMLYGSIQASTRFMGFNRLTASHIFMTTIGYGATKIQDVLKFTGVALGGGIPLLFRNVLQSVTGKTFGSIVDSNKYLYLPDDEIVIRAADTNAMRDYTAGELRQIGVDTGFEYSRAAAEFYDDQYKGLLEAMKMTPQGKMKSTIRSLYDKAVSNVLGQSNYLADFTHLQDAELRRLVFIESLKTGATVEDSVSLAKQVLLDYTTLSTFEKTTFSRYVRFYAFMRTMTVATINNFYRGIVGNSSGAFAPRLLRAQNSLTKESSQDFVSMTDDQRGRLFNLYAGTVDDVDLYLSGPPNPQVQAFELVGMLPLFMLGAVTDNRPMGKEEVELESAVWSTINQLVNVTKEKAFEASEATPFVEYFLKSYAASQGAYRRPFPKEFIYAAEQQGILDDVIRRYDLVPRYRTPGRPLTEEGLYYSFRQGTDGLKGYRAYLLDRMLGAYTIPAAVVGVYGIGGVQKDRIAVSTRAINEYWKMRMLEEGVQSPDIRAKYLKSATIQKDMGMFQNILGMAYQMGVVTPTSSRSKKFIVDRAMRDAKKTQEKLGQSNEKQ